MGNRACLTVVVLALLLAALPCAADDGKVEEPATGISFQTAGPDGMVLLGVGVRKKMVFNVYAAALYVDAAALARETEHSTAAERVNKAVWTGWVPRVMLMHFVRDVPADKVREAFRESLANNMTVEDFNAEKAGIEEFLNGVSDVKKGEVFTFRSSGEDMRILQGKKEIFNRSGRKLMAGMWGSWFGKKPICPKLKKDLISRAAEVLGR
jgi:hypothetical protein